MRSEDIITGFPDATFKPEQPVSCAKFAAMIQKAFNQNLVRQLSTGEFRDIPADYWAISAAQEAYETGFMSGYAENFFFRSVAIEFFRYNVIYRINNQVILRGSTKPNIFKTLLGSLEPPPNLQIFARRAVLIPVEGAIS